MPNFAVQYKSETDTDGRTWGIGAIHNRYVALDVFNDNDARKEGIGPFTFEETQPSTDYHLVEQEDPMEPVELWPIYPASASSAF
jgi:hypothetical protein